MAVKIKNIVSDWDGVLTTGDKIRKLPLKSIGYALMKESLNPFSKIRRKHPQCRFFHLLKTKKKLEKLDSELIASNDINYGAKLVKIFNEKVVKGLPANYVYGCISKAVWNTDLNGGVSKKMLRVFAKLKREGDINYLAILSDNSQMAIFEILFKMKMAQIFDDVVGTPLQSEERIAIGFSYDSEGSKVSRLWKILNSKGIENNAAYIGDGPNDVECFESVKFPIISPYASDEFKQINAIKYKAFAPKDESDLKNYIKTHQK